MTRVCLWLFVLSALPGLARETPPAAEGEVPAEIQVAPDPVAVLIEQGQWDQARAAVDQFLQAAPDDLARLFQKARILRRQKNHAAAVTVYDRILTLDPGNPDASGFQVLLLLQLARAAEPKEALTIFARAAALPVDPSSYLGEYLALVVAKGAPEEAVDVYRRFAASHTIPTDTTITIADRCAAARRFDDAAALYRDVLDKQAGQPDALNGFIRILLEMGHPVLAWETAKGWPDAVAPAVRTAVDQRMQATRDLWQGATLGEPARARLSNTPLVLSYGHITLEPDPDNRDLDLGMLLHHIEFLRLNDFRFVSVADILDARSGRRPLPPRAVLLTFNVGYASFAERVWPLLRLYRCPSLLLLRAAWLSGAPPANLPAPLMTWAQVRATAADGMVTLGSLTHALDHDVTVTPQGDRAAAGMSRTFFREAGQYETDAYFRERIQHDLETSRKLIQQMTEIQPHGIAWPGGRFNGPGTEVAEQLGLTVQVADQPWHTTGRRRVLARWAVPPAMDMPAFVGELESWLTSTRQPSRASRPLYVNLDLLDTSPEADLATEIDRVVDRVEALGVSSVQVQGYVDPEHDGNAEAVYFPNRVLPVKSDILGHLAAQLHLRGIEVHVRMPVLSILPPDRMTTQRMSVRVPDALGVRSPTPLFRRLSPFSTNAQHTVASLYEGLAAHVDLDGIVFEEDAYLTDHEDFHPAALPAIKAVDSLAALSPMKLVRDQPGAWIQLKSAQLNRFTGELMTTVRAHRPNAVFARTLFAPALLNPLSERWLAQNYEESLCLYDRVVIMAYPEMLDIKNPEQWLLKIVHTATAHPDGLEKTMFELQAYNWDRARWIDSGDLQTRLRAMAAAGARHLTYFPDNPALDRPRAKDLRKAMSPAMP